MQIKQLGLTPYRLAYNYQMELLKKQHDDEQNEDVCLMLEHPSVFTLGRNGSPDNVIVPVDFLQKQGINVVKIERGGEVTYHGPGQIVCYPIINLRRNKLGVAEFVHTLEQIMLRVVRHFGIQANRDSRNHGIWHGNHKLGSVGIAVRHGISYHGLALNVNIDLEPFAWMNPCGLSGVLMSSMEQELQHSLNIREVKSVMAGVLSQSFGGSVN